MAVDKKWFTDRLADRKLSQRQLARLIEMDNTALNKALNEAREFGPEELAAIAATLNIPYDEVCRRAGVAVPSDERTMVGVVGVIDAMGELSAKVAGPRRVDRPAKTSSELVAARVASPGSMMDGWVLYYEPGARLDPEAVGQPAVVKLEDGRVFARVLQRGFDRGKWTLKPLVPGERPDIENIGILSAVPVTWIKLR